MQFSKTSPLKSGESSEKSSGENRVKSCHVCGCHGFFGPDRLFHMLITIGNSRITFHHFIFRELLLVIISSWFTSKNSGRIISRNLSDLRLLLHLPRHTQSLHQKILRKLFFVKIPCPLHQNIQGSVNGGFQTVVRVFWGNEILLPPFYLNLTSFLPQFYLCLTSFLPLFSLNLTSASSRLSNHGLETTVYIPLEYSGGINIVILAFRMVVPKSYFVLGFYLRLPKCTLATGKGCVFAHLEYKFEPSSKFSLRQSWGKRRCNAEGATKLQSETFRADMLFPSGTSCSLGQILFSSLMRKAMDHVQSVR